jgi:hypothetical protein
MVNPASRKDAKAISSDTEGLVISKAMVEAVSREAVSDRDQLMALGGLLFNKRLRTLCVQQR